MIPKKLTKDDILLAADAAAVWPEKDFRRWIAGKNLTAVDICGGYTIEKVAVPGHG